MSIQRIVSRLNIPNLRSGDSSRDRDTQKEQPSQRDPDDRNPTQEEAQQALQALLEMEQVKSSGLSAEVANEEGAVVILVKNASGAVLKTLRRADVIRLLSPAAGATRAAPGGTGRILDRRI